MSRSGGTERMTAILANALSKKHEVSILDLHAMEIVSFLWKVQ